mgnify:FL=1
MRERRRIVTGVVTSNKMEQTVVVKVERSYRHPLYGKVVRSHRKYVAHDSGNDCRVGDTVSIRESRPLSKTKRWVVEQIVNREELPGQ